MFRRKKTPAAVYAAMIAGMKAAADQVEADYASVAASFAHVTVPAHVARAAAVELRRIEEAARRWRAAFERSS